MAKLADMKFPAFRAEGEEHPLGYSLYEDKYEYDPRTEVRREAYKAFYGKLPSTIYFRDSSMVTGGT